MKSLNRRQAILQNQRGNALLETIPLLVVFVILVSFGLGIFGIVHTSVLHSIAARTYSFETFRNRTNISYFREDGSGLDAGKAMNYTKKGWRYHAVQRENDDRDRFVATPRAIAFGRTVAAGETSQDIHNQQIYSMQQRNDRFSVSPAWVMVGYGICINATCGN